MRAAWRCAGGRLSIAPKGRIRPIPLHRIRLPRDATPTARFRPDLLGGVAVIESPARTALTDGFDTTLYRPVPPKEEGTTLTAVPYYIWCNRGPNPMQVWLRE